MFKSIIIIGIGGFIGTVLRFLTTRYIQIQFNTTFPLGTLLVNITGCFLIGVLYALTERGNLISNDIRLFLIVGICGGYTTFSTFSNDGLILLQNNEIFKFSMYASISVFVGILSTLLGRLLIKSI